MDFDLNPGLRDRIINELNGSKIAEDSRVAYLSALTGRAVQTARRWIDLDTPGLPDLESFARLCCRFNSDANWMLGLTHVRYPLPMLSETATANKVSETQSCAEWIGRLLAKVGELSSGYEINSMVGDDMEPRIKNGAPIWVDTAINDIEANGIYLLKYQGRTLVRQVEIRIGEGLVLTCENARYKPVAIKDLATAKKSGLMVLGRVMLSICIDRM